MAENDLPLFLNGHGYFEEIFFSFQFILILDEHESVAGYHEPIAETTKYYCLFLSVEHARD